MALSGTPGSGLNPRDPEAPDPSSTSSTPATRRSLRAARAASASVSAASAPAASAPAASAPAARTSASSAVEPAARTAAPKSAKPKKKGWAVNVAVMTVATGIIATMSLPAFAFNPSGADSAAFGPSAADSMKKAQPQSVQVAQGVAASAVSREAPAATSEQQLAEQKAAELARQEAAVSLANYANSYSGPSVSDFLKNPPYPKFSLAQVFSVAQQYIGTPYVFGGSTPAGFDCSGYVMFVYAQFGISLPHSVSGQAALGKRISIEDAQPGDVVIMPGHDGFYAGNGNILDAPDSGRSISIRPIWTTDYYIVRLGI